MGTTAPFPDYKALVCVFLFGGNDSYNMVVPNSTAEYNAYAASRQNLAIAQGDLLPINPLSLAPGSNPFGFHPSMAGMQSLFETGKAAVVANVGPLVEPTTRDQFFNQSVTLPSQLFSHNDQRREWQTSVPQTRSSNCSRLQTRPGFSMKVLRSRNSVGPSFNGLPARVTLWVSASSRMSSYSSRSPTAAGRVRRSCVRTRAMSSTTE